MLPPFRSTRPPSRPTAPSARRIYSALRASVVRCCSGLPRRSPADIFDARLCLENSFPNSTPVLSFAWKQALVRRRVGRVKWMGVLNPPRAPPCESLPHRRFEVAAASHPFCVDENPRLTACTAWIACLRCKPTSRASYSIIFGVVQRIPTAILFAFSYTASFSVHRVTGTRLSLGTRSHNRSPLDRN
ncbi:hypothetical protein B0H14DRAFT_1167119 [Mycena olivaceomarginata]|nr:hypothetical protein B0H14DRAFT_1167119 [Mycena olivaceomarginata]